jgi:alpha-L-rhamnosidase
MPSHVSVADFPDVRWRGQWIWVPEEPVTPTAGWGGEFIGGGLPEAHGLFRRTFELASVPSRVPARITADSRYRLFVNGIAIGRGPIRSQARRLHYDLYDLAPYLRIGSNVIAVYVKYYGRERAFWMPAIPNRTLGRTGILVFEADLGETGWLVSDESWRARLSDAWLSPDPQGGDAVTHGIPTEIHDARRLAVDWHAADVDDRSWGAAQVIPSMLSGSCRTTPPAHPYGPMLPRPIAHLGGERIRAGACTIERRAYEPDPGTSDPVVRNERAFEAPLVGPPVRAQLPLSLDLVAGTVCRLELDLGRVVSGLVELEIAAPAGTGVDISFLEEPMRPDAGGFGRMRAGCRYVARGADDRFQFFDVVGFRYANVLVHGGPGRADIRVLGVQELIYPWQESAAFACSDRDIERIVTAGLRTVALCSGDAIVDCPTREQRAWVGDAVVGQLVHLAANADWRLALRYLDLCNSPRSDGILPMFVVGLGELIGSNTLPDWSLHWIHGVYSAYRYAGDREHILELFPTVVRVLRWYSEYRAASGLLRDVPEWNLIDWSSVSTSDTSAAINALWARGLRELAEIAGWLGENATQRWAEHTLEGVRSGFEAFWDEARGVYVDHIVDGVRQPATNQIPGAAAIVAGLAPSERWARIIDVLTDADRLVVRSWSGGGQDPERTERVLRGIYDIDWDVEREIVIAEPFMSYVVHDAVVAAGRADLLPRLHRRWLEFLVDGYDTLGENWGAGTHCHGWSAAPTRDALTYLLGITPAEPGFGRVRIAPNLGGLEWAKGSVPTPHGRVSVDVSLSRCVIESPVAIELEFAGVIEALPAGHHIRYSRQEAGT